MWVHRGSVCTDTTFCADNGCIQLTTGKKTGNLKNPQRRRAFLRHYAWRGWALCEQVHGNTIAVVSGSFKGERIFPQCDGLATDRVHIALGIYTADCVPVFYRDAKKKVVAIVHAGWRGTHAGLPGLMIRVLKKKFACDPKMLRISLGPHIRSCCYSVGKDLRDAFHIKGKAVLSLQKEIISQLVGNNVRAGNITAAPWCTAHDRALFYSYRKEKGTENRMLSVIGMV